MREHSVWSETPPAILIEVFAANEATLRGRGLVKELVGEDTPAFVFSCLGQEVVHVAVEIGSGFVHDQECGSTLIFGYDGALQHGLEDKRDEDAA